MIQRIEIVKGPQSTLYGSDALGGVVNIITRDLATRAWGGSLGVQGGTQGRRDLTGSLLGAAGPVHFSADLGRRDVNLTPGRDDQIGTEAGRWDGALKARWRPDSSLALEASTLLLDEGQRFRIGTNWFFADRQQATARLAGTWTRGRTRIAPTLHYTHFDHLYRRSLQDRPLSRLGDHDTQRLLVGEVLASHARGRTVLDAGTAVRRESAASTRVISDRGATNGLRDRLVAEPYAQVTVGGGDGRWSVVPGLRLTADEQWGTHWTPRVATMFRPADRLALRASAGRGFRAPDFKEQFLQFQHISESFAYFVRGNPALRPELSDNVSGSVEWAGSRLYVRADLFDNRFRDFIESRVVGDTTVASSASPIAYYTYGNVGRGRTYGTDVEGVLRLGVLRIDGGYSWLEARDQDADRPLLGRARHTARLGLGGTLANGASGTLNAQWTGAAPVAIGGAGTPLVRDGWLRVNARVAHTLVQALGGAWRAELGATNLLDARPNLWPGFTGRQLYTGLTWQAGRALTPRAERPPPRPPDARVARAPRQPWTRAPRAPRRPARPPSPLMSLPVRTHRRAARLVRLAALASLVGSSTALAVRPAAAQARGGGAVRATPPRPASTGAVRANAARIVSIGGGITETLAAIGYLDRIVGIDLTSSGWPPSVAKLAAGGAAARDLGRGDPVAPTDAGRRQRGGGTAGGALAGALGGRAGGRGAPGAQRARGLPALSRGGDGGGPAGCGGLARARGTAGARARARRDPGGARPRVLFLYARGPRFLLVFGQESAGDEMLQLAGAENAVTGFTGAKPLTPESVVGAAPDVILVPARGLHSLGGIDGCSRSPGSRRRRPGVRGAWSRSTTRSSSASARACPTRYGRSRGWCARASERGPGGPAHAGARAGRRAGRRATPAARGAAARPARGRRRARVGHRRRGARAGASGARHRPGAARRCAAVGGRRAAARGALGHPAAAHRARRAGGGNAGDRGRRAPGDVPQPARRPRAHRRVERRVARRGRGDRPRRAARRERGGAGGGTAGDAAPADGRVPGRAGRDARRAAAGAPGRGRDGRRAHRRGDDAPVRDRRQRDRRCGGGAARLPVDRPAAARHHLLVAGERGRGDVAGGGARRTRSRWSRSWGCRAWPRSSTCCCWARRRPATWACASSGSRGRRWC
jgi:hypothetical protein